MYKDVVDRPMLYNVCTKPITEGLMKTTDSTEQIHKSLPTRLRFWFVFCFEIGRSNVRFRKTKSQDSSKNVSPQFV